MLVESFPVKDSIQKHVNVFSNETGFYNLDEVHKQHPTLDGKHIVWIFKRLLAAIGLAHQAGIIHAAVLPEHVMIYPGMANQKDDKAHALMLVGWGHSVKNGEIVKTISTKYRDWYPPEVLEKKQVGPGTDIYLAAKCMLHLAGDDGKHLPSSMTRFLKSLVLAGLKMRPDDAWDLFDEFALVAKNIYGTPKFHTLAMA